MFYFQGANASALEKEIGSEQFPVNEHYFGLVNVSRDDNLCPYAFLQQFGGVITLHDHSLILCFDFFLFSDCSSGTPATATRCCRLCISAGRSGKKSWPTAASPGARKTCSPVWQTCSTASPTRRGKWVSSPRRSSLRDYGKRMVRICGLIYSFKLWARLG